MSTFKTRLIDLKKRYGHPADAMREDICRAEVGDDAMGEDSTVNRLESLQPNY